MSFSEIVSFVGVGIAAGSMIIAYYSSRQANRQIVQLQQAITLFHKATQTYDNEVVSLKKEIDLRKNKLGFADDILIRAEVEKQKIAQKERELQWRKLKDLGRAWKWLQDQ